MKLSINDMFIYILKKWKIIFGVGLFLGIGVLSFEMIQMSYRGENAGIIASNDEEIAHLKKLLDEQEDYIENSYGMKIDPYNYPEQELTYCVVSESEQLDKSLVNAYEEILFSDEMVNSIADKMGIKDERKKYLGSLIGLQESELGADSYTTVFKVLITGEDEAFINNLSEALQEKMSFYKNEFTSNIGEHTLYLLDVSNSVGYNEEHKEHIENIYARYEELKGQLAQKQADAGAKFNNEGISINKVIFFSTIGMLLVIFLLGMLYCFSDRVHLEDDLETITGKPLIGNISNKKKNFWYNETIWKRKKVSYGKQLEILQSKYEGLMGAIEGVALISSCGDKISKEVVNDIVENVPGLVYGGNLLIDESAFKLAKKMNAVIFMEVKENSVIRNIVKEKNVCEKYGIEVVGSIFLE